MHDEITYISIRKVENLNHEMFTIKLSSEEKSGAFSMSMYETKNDKQVLLLKFFSDVKAFIIDANDD